MGMDLGFTIKAKKSDGREIYCDAGGRAKYYDSSAVHMLGLVEGMFPEMLDKDGDTKFHTSYYQEEWDGYEEGSITWNGEKEIHTTDSDADKMLGDFNHVKYVVLTPAHQLDNKIYIGVKGFDPDLTRLNRVLKDEDFEELYTLSVEDE